MVGQARQRVREVRCPSASCPTRATVLALLLAAILTVSFCPVKADPVKPPDATQQLVQQASALFFPEDPEAASHGGGSATITLNELKALGPQVDPGLLGEVGSFLNRPTTLPLSEASAHFVVHYTDQGPDAPSAAGFVGEALAACEASWAIYHQEQGWPHPPAADDASAPGMVDVYVLDLGWGVYGYALHEEIEDAVGCAGFIVVDNDFAGFSVADPMAALRTTVAHEYHHVVQFGFGYDASASWFMEQTATMEEATVYPDIDGLNAYLRAYGSHAHLRLDMCNGFFEYGAWLWPRFIRERWSWSTLIDVWREWGGGEMPMLTALDLVLAQAESERSDRLAASRPDATTLDAALLEWFTWNALLGRPVTEPGRQYEDGEAWSPPVAPEWVIDHYPAQGLRPAPVRRPQPMGGCLVSLAPQPTSADNTLRLELEAGAGLAGARLILFRQDSQAFEVHNLALEAGAAELSLSHWDQAARAVLLLTNGQGAPQSGDFLLDVRTTYVNSASVGDPTGLEMDKVLLHARPNPFEPYTVVQYDLPQDAHIRLRIFDAQGRVVETLVDGVASGGSHAIYWDGRGRGGVRAPAGVYYGRLESAYGSKEMRLVRVR